MARPVPLPISLPGRRALRPRAPFSASAPPIPDEDASLGPITPLLDVGRWLQATGYRFTCVTPATQAHSEARDPLRAARSLRDVFGWNRPFRDDTLPRAIVDLLNQAHSLEALEGGLHRCTVRYSTLQGRLFLHDGAPTRSTNAVFFGPDTTRFVNFLRRAIDRPRAWPVRRLVDLGCGTGAGAILAADLLETRELQRALLRDLNPRALRMAATNLALNASPAMEVQVGDGLQGADDAFDLIVSNPPYMIDPAGRAYRDGGEAQGTALPLRFLRDAIAHLAPGGRIAFYTGTPVVDGQDVFWRAARPLLEAAQLRFDYEELDPDVHGDSLALPEYRDVERIAAVGLLAHRT